MEGNRMQSTDPAAETRAAAQASWLSILINAALAAFKCIAGILGHSGAMLSDAVHSLSDVVSTFVVLVGVRLSRRDADREHPYGHERIEYIASIILATLLVVTGLTIGFEGVKRILGASELLIPGRVALVAAVASIVIKEWMYHYTKRVAKRVGSGALMASAWHHRSDALSSVGSFAGILGARLGLPVLDPIASVIICLLILKASYDIYRDAIDKLVDRACPPETEAALRTVVESQSGVCRVDQLITRQFGQMMYVDVEIAVDESLLLSDAHDVAARVHAAIEASRADIKHCMVHVNPCRAGSGAKHTDSEK